MWSTGQTTMSNTNVSEASFHNYRSGVLAKKVLCVAYILVELMNLSNSCYNSHTKFGQSLIKKVTPNTANANVRFP